jgi:hypothetical protein
MIESLILGGLAMVACLVIQCVVVAVVIGALIALDRKGIIRPTFAGISSLLVAVMLIMLAGNLLQMTLWAWLFYVTGEFEAFATAFYHSVVNFSTLGYGDLVMSDDRRLLGGLEAANGIMMFGLTTSVLFAVLNAFVRRAPEMKSIQDA